MSEVLAKLEKKGGGGFDISSVQPGYCATLESSYYLAGYKIVDITTKTNLTPSALFNGSCIGMVINADGFSTLALGNNNVTNCSAFGLNEDGTLTPIYCNRLSNNATITITTTGYKYIIVSMPTGQGLALYAQIS